MAQTTGFIAKHGLWDDEQRRQAEEIRRRIEKDAIKLVRVAWADPHGASRAKTVTAAAFIGALTNGYNINVATHTLDLAGARVFGSFTTGGGMNLPEMTGSPNLTIVPDPATFRVLPWAPDIGWVMCDEYFDSGVPFHFLPRQLLKKQLARLAERKMAGMIGLEVEWYLLRPAEDHLTTEHVGMPGLRGRAIKTWPAEPGFILHSETNFDLIQTPMSALADACEKLDLPLTSIENEWGPGQVECTFSPLEALRTADNLVLFRTATRQLMRRMGYFVTFMPRPAIPGYYSSGWHLHQSLIDKTSGQNLFTPQDDAVLSPLGMHYLAGLMHSAVASTPFTTPTVNGYRRFRANSLAPDRCTWSFDHRGVQLRVLGGPGSKAARIENRAGEPAANPYLYIASQIVAGLDGIDNKRNPGPPCENPYSSTEHAMLPKSLPAALEALSKSELMRTQLGPVFMDYFLKLKGSEAQRFAKWLEDNKLQAGDEPTAWEQDEYFDFF